MDDLVILHLSDLHITGITPYSKLLDGLLNDISNEVKKFEDHSVVVAVTGDILHQGNPDAVSPALEFFRRLRKILREKFLKIYIVPGNHDKKRTPENKLIVPAYRLLMQQEDKELSEFGGKFYDVFWSHHIDSYSAAKGSGYLELTKRIYEIFGESKDQIDNCRYVDDTYGVDILDVNGKKICFVLLNTAWSCINDTDNRNLVIGKFQLDSIKQQHQIALKELGDEEVVLTVVMGHHPLSAFGGKEEDNLFADMISFEELDADVYLCGHTHDRAIINWSNNRHTINTLVSGIGWPEQRSFSGVGVHTYSQYVFNIDANSADIYVRSTDDGGRFVPDFRIYSSTAARDSQRIVFPIREKRSQTYITLNAADERNPRAYYLTDEFIGHIQQYTSGINRFMYLMGNAMEYEKANIWEDLTPLDNPNLDEEIVYTNDNDVDDLIFNYLYVASEEEDIPDQVLAVFQQNKILLFETLLGLLRQICEKLYEEFVDEECNDCIRFHFRFLSDKNTLTYPCFCSYMGQKHPHSHNDVSEMKYGDLLQKSFENKCSLIYSLNRSLCQKAITDKWKNFITIVPTMSKNTYSRKNWKNKKEYPYLTFAVTISSEKYNWLLYCLDFFEFSKVLDEIIGRYVDKYQINLSDFCKWLRESGIYQKGDE